jgi:membrane-associated phospholipid phosphatase
MNPEPVVLAPVQGAEPKEFVRLGDVAEETTGLVVTALTPRRYTLRLPDPGGRVAVSLAGDVTGDFRVTRADLDGIRSRLDTDRGEAGYLRAADVDGDGTVSQIDLDLARKNLGAATSLRTLSVVAGVAPASDPDGNRVVLRPEVALTGQARPGVTVQIDLSADGTFEGTSRTDATGRFRLGTTLARGGHDVRVVATDGFGQTAATDLEVAFGDVVLDWNAVHLTAIRDYTVFSQVPYSNRIVHTSPPLAARNLAMVQAAIYDAVNAAEGLGRPYRFTGSAPAGTSPVAAAATAAWQVLKVLYPRPEQSALFDAALAESLATVPDGPGKEAGRVLGQQIAADMLAWRATDGSRATSTYLPGTDPGDWRPTLPDFIPPNLPQWPGVTPFGVADVSAFRPPPPPALDSPEYAGAVNEVMAVGRFDSSARTAEQTAIALFWGDGPGTATPPGHWNRIARDIVLARDLSLAETARVLAALNVALADAGIASWDAKYHYDLWRPVDAVRRAAEDGNPATEADPAWAPLLKTPPFPSYTSGHSTFSGSAAAVLTRAFGADVGFTSRTDGLDGFTQRPLGAAAITTRSFDSFAQAAHEASLSRVYGGIHYSFDGTAGLAVGGAVGEVAAARFFDP